MFLYAYTFNGYRTNSDPFYKNRVKLGETGRVGTKKAGMDVYDAIKARIKQQDTSGISEEAVIVGFWDVETDVDVNVDDRIRKILIDKYGAVETRDDKRKTEWVSLPVFRKDDQKELIEKAIADFDAEIREKVSKKINLRPQQKSALNRVIQGLENRDRSVCHAACAFGKTFVELALNDVYVPGDKEVNVIFTSGRELCNQVAGEFMNHTINGVDEVKWKDIIVHSYNDVVEGVEVTNDVDRIAAEIEESNLPVRLFVLYDSTLVAAEAIHKAGRSVNLKIMDEAHRTATQNQSKNTWALRMKCNKQASFTASLKNIVV